MKRSSAATTAAASSGEAAGATMRNWGRRFTPRSCQQAQAAWWVAIRAADSVVE
jgi:hypothetical protein